MAKSLAIPVESCWWFFCFVCSGMTSCAGSRWLHNTASNSFSIWRACLEQVLLFLFFLYKTRHSTACGFPSNASAMPHCVYWSFFPANADSMRPVAHSKLAIWRGQWHKAPNWLHSTHFGGLLVEAMQATQWMNYQTVISTKIKIQF